MTQLFACDTVGLYAMDVEAFCGMGNGQYLGLECYPSEDEGTQHRLFWLTPAEGGFSEKEVNFLVQSGAESVSLGKTILRTETAGPAMLAMVFYALEL